MLEYCVDVGLVVGGSLQHHGGVAIFLRCLCLWNRCDGWRRETAATARLYVSPPKERSPAKTNESPAKIENFSRQNSAPSTACAPRALSLLPRDEKMTKATMTQPASGWHLPSRTSIENHWAIGKRRASYQNHRFNNTITYHYHYEVSYRPIVSLCCWHSRSLDYPNITSFSVFDASSSSCSWLWLFIFISSVGGQETTT